jgi:pimeloyl-ACP methyl ester carboxylesterase
MKSTIQFAHANGFPAETYNEFFKHFKDYDLKYIPIMGHRKAGIHPNWKPLGHELIAHIKEHQQQPVIGIGHSMGGAALMYAAYWQPELFEKIVFLDPPLFRTSKRLGFDFMRLVGMVDKVGPSGKAKTRKTHFESYDAAYQYFQPKKLFKDFHPNCFKDYVEHGLTESPQGGLELAFKAEIEYQVFRTMAHIPGKIVFKMPSYFIYSKTYSVLDINDIKWLERKFINTKFIGVDGGHLFPLEQPMETANLIKNLIQF